MMEKILLNNGLIILFYPMDTAYSITISLNIHAGTFLESKSNNGITHLLEHLHFRSLKNMTQEELYYLMDSIGGNLIGKTYRELLRFYMKIHPCYLYDALKIFKNIICTSSWSDDDINKEKTIILSEMIERNSFFDIDRETGKFLLKGTPYAMPILGREKTLKNITHKDIEEYKRLVFSKENVALAVSGKFGETEIDNISKYFEDIKLGAYYEKADDFNFKDYCRIKFVECNLEYYSVVMSFRLNDAIDKFEAAFLNTMLGGGAGAILQKEIREKDCMSYSVFSELEVYKKISFLKICLMVDNYNLFFCINKVIEILNSLKKFISDEYMNVTRPYYTYNQWFLLENTAEINEELSWDVFAEKQYSISEKIDICNKINSDMLSDTAKKIFCKNNCDLIIFGREKIKKKQLQNILEELG